ncbi:PREDICTED: IQ and ubiquitin-like domain-containing protein [Cyprinodon variegatus]|uniref:IQ and ubiquitin-like domain-containing protein n=1 Tax=Cyprinodon variegatus TaxID=28743 RepID=UPI0007425A15|nr:PREDICTED: IQ and ubiquitin-like domain-containing protein [Cyprinodon variegatus]
MLKAGEGQRKEGKEGEEERLRSGGSTTAQPPGGSRESDRFGEEAREDLHLDLKDSGAQAEGLPETLEAAQNDFPNDLEEHEEKTNMKNSAAVGEMVEKQHSLMELGVQPHSSTQMEGSSSEPNLHQLPLLCLEQEDMSDFITVQVQNGMAKEGMFKEVMVEIECSKLKKPFLGGYRHRLTGVEYHHASVQTLPKRRPDRGVPVCIQSTQTVDLRSTLQQCPVDASTQMTGIGCYVSCLRDKLIIPGKYTTAAEYHGRRLEAVICLQSHVRRWLAQEKVEQMRKERLRRLAWFQLQEKNHKEEQLRRRLNPQSRQDYDLLYSALEKWRAEAEQQIKSTLRGAERKVALCSLLETETQLIAAIGRHHIGTAASNHDRMIKDFLSQCSAPHQWRSAGGHLLQMDTPHDIRARELSELYQELSLFNADRQHRRDLLQKIRNTVEEHKCPLVREIIDLIDREMDLMRRNVKERNLEGLRKRICTLFLQYIKTPAFNPKVAKLLKVHKKPSELRQDMVFCLSCRRYLCSADFGSGGGGRRTGRCQNCTSLQNAAGSRHEDSAYRNILRKLRADEARLKAEGSLPFLLQVEDIRYLTEKVWGSRSALSGSEDVFSLVFARWQRQKDWSPWNCILLSKDESSLHWQIEDIHQVYETTFIQQIEQKHLWAKLHFSKNPAMAKYLAV